MSFGRCLFTGVKLIQHTKNVCRIPCVKCPTVSYFEQVCVCLRSSWCQYSVPCTKPQPFNYVLLQWHLCKFSRSLLTGKVSGLSRKKGNVRLCGGPFNSEARMITQAWTDLVYCHILDLGRVARLNHSLIW